MMKSASWLERLLGPKTRPRCRGGRKRAHPNAAHGTAACSRESEPHDDSQLRIRAKGDGNTFLAYPFDNLSGAHWLCGGATGCGKSRFVAGLMARHIRAFVRLGFPGLVLLDPKSETVDLVLRLIGFLLPNWSKEEQERVLANLVVVAPCRRNAAVTPLQLLSAPGAEAESRAAEVSEALTHGIEADLGILQEGVLANVLALAIESGQGWSLVELPHLLSSEPLVRQMATRSSLPGPRAYVLSGRFGKEASHRVSGIQARIEKLLRIERLRLALGAPELLDLSRCFRGRITLVDLGSDYGAEEATRVIGRLLFSRLVASLFSQPAEALRPTLLVCEEFPDLMGKGLGAKAEKLFSQARSRQTGCMILFQAPTQLQNGGLLRVLQANARFTILGQMPEAEARCFEELLPQTGRVPRELGPGEVLPKTLYLGPPEERVHRLQEIGHLERGAFLFSDRSQRESTCLIQADHCNPPSWDELERQLGTEIVDRLRRGAVSLPLAQAEASYKARLERVAELLAPAPALPSFEQSAGSASSRGKAEEPSRAGTEANNGASAETEKRPSRRSRRKRGEMP